MKRPGCQEAVHAHLQPGRRGFRRGNYLSHVGEATLNNPSRNAPEGQEYRLGE
jgi:hypothetical protein